MSASSPPGSRTEFWINLNRGGRGLISRLHAIDLVTQIWIARRATIDERLTRAMASHMGHEEED